MRTKGRWILVAAMVVANALLASSIASRLGAQHTAMICSQGQFCTCTANNLCFAGTHGGNVCSSTVHCPQ